MSATSLRMILWWKVPQDLPLLDDLNRFRARARGKRLRYLARLGQRAEALGLSLEGQCSTGELRLPINVSTMEVPQVAVVPAADAAAEPPRSAAIDAFVSEYLN